MKKIYLLLTLSFLFFVNASGQYYLNQNKVWAFGIQVRLDFNSGTPLRISTNMNIGMGEPEGCASVSDTLGHLLFYSNGKVVYNRTGAVMPNGLSIVSFDPSSTEQAALIIPVIGKSDQYYLFSLGSIGDGQLAYSIVDMTLDAGLGDVVSASMGTPLQNSLGENMIAVPGNNKNIWLVTHMQDTSLFLAFNITASGISSPVVSTTGSFHGHFCYGWSMLRGSTNRKKIAQGVYKSEQCYGIQLYDFDPATGFVSNCVSIDAVDTATYGIEFSPDNTKIYTNGGNKITQYNIALPTLAAIQASKYVVSDSSYGADLRLAPNGKIYFRGSHTYDLHSINSPNLSAASCGYSTHAVKITDIYQTFPSLYVIADTNRKVDVVDIQNDSYVTLFPNPASTECTITYTGTMKAGAKITIYDVTGRLLHTYPLTGSTTTVSIAELQPGMYQCRIDVDGGPVSKKLVVMS